MVWCGVVCLCVVGGSSESGVRVVRWCVLLSSEVLDPQSAWLPDWPSKHAALALAPAYAPEPDPAAPPPPTPALPVSP